MKLINYRRFVGENIINFSSDDEKNITIIDGALKNKKRRPKSVY